MESPKVRHLLLCLFVYSHTTAILLSVRAPLVLTQSKQGPEIISPKDRWLAKGAGDEVDTVTNQSIKLSGSKPSISINNKYDLICSYNWVNKKEPAVYVPGEVCRRGISFSNWY